MARARARFYIPLILFLLIFIGGYYYLISSDGLERIANSQINKLLGQKLPLEMKIGSIGGDLLSGVVLHDITVSSNDSADGSMALRIGHVTAAYSIANLWNKKYLFDYIYVDSATIRLVEDSSGHLVLPFALMGGNAAGSLPLLGVDELTFRNSRLIYEGQFDTIVVDGVTLVCSLELSDKTYSVEIQQVAFHSDEQLFNLSAANGRITLANGMLLAQELLIVSQGTRIRASGQYSPETGVGRLTFAIDSLDLADIGRVAGPKLNGIIDINGELLLDSGAVSGTATLGGNFMIASLENLYLKFNFENKRLAIDTVYGLILGNCALDGRAGIDFSGETERYFLDADIKNFDLSHLIKGSIESDLSGEIRLSGSSLNNAMMAIHVEMDLAESMFGGYPIQYGHGGIDITTSKVSFAEPFRVDYFENVLYGKGEIEYKGEMNLDLRLFLNNLDRYRGKFFIDQPGGRGYAEATLSGKSNDPNLKGVFHSDSVWIYGIHSDSLVATFAIDRFLTGREGKVELWGMGGTFYNSPYDSMMTIVIVDSNLAFIEKAEVRNDYASVSARGLLDYGTVPQHLALDTVEVSILNRTFYNHGEITIDIDSIGFELVAARMGNALAGFSSQGRINFDETIALQLSVDNVPVAPWLKLFGSEEFAVDGNLSCEADLAGSFASPSFQMRGRVDSLSYRDLMLGDLRVSTRFKDGLMTIDSARIESGTGVFSVAGQLHTNLALTSQSVTRLPDKPMDLQLSAVDSRFDLVSLLLPSVEAMRGDFFADVRLTGSPAAPHLEGHAYLRNGALKYFDLVDSLYTDSAAFTMADNRITIDSVYTYVKDKKGKKRKAGAIVTGELTVLSIDNLYYDIDIDIPSALPFPFRYELDEIEGDVVGRLHIEGETPPTVSGDLVMLSMKYYVQFAEPNQGSPLMAALAGEDSWDVNINIEIPSGYLIRNEDIDAEFAGFINFVREDGKYRFVGEMSILRGKAFLFDKTFRIDQGSQVFFEGNDPVNPRLNIQARARIPGPPSGDDNAPRDIELGIQVTGTLENPDLNTLGGDSELTREDILPLIVANYYSPEGVTTGGGIESRVSQMIGNQIGQIGTRQFSRIGVETFEIDPVYGGQVDLARTRVTVGFRTTRNLYVYGRSSLSLAGGQEVGFEYRMSRLMLFEGRRDEDELHHLNLRLRWEF